MQIINPTTLKDGNHQYLKLSNKEILLVSAILQARKLESAESIRLIEGVIKRVNAAGSYQGAFL